MRFDAAGESVLYTSGSYSATAGAQTDESVLSTGLTGRDGWLFSKSATDLLHHKRDESVELIQSWHREIAQREACFADRHIRYFHVCVPDKLTIHGEFLDGQSSSYSAADRFSPLHILSAHESALDCLINPTGYLQRQVGHYPLYWKSDTRWTPWSAYMTCQLLCSALKDEINNLLLGYPHEDAIQLMNLDANCWPDEPEEIRTYRLCLRSRRRYSNDLVRLRETAVNPKAPWLAQAEYAEGAHVVFENNHEKACKRSVVIFGDEHSADSRSLLTGMLAETYQEVHFVWSRAIDYDYVETVQPHVVITQGSEVQLLAKPEKSIDMGEVAARSMQNIHTSTLTLVGAHQQACTPQSASQVDCAPVASRAHAKVILPSERYALDPPVMVQTYQADTSAETSMVSNEVVLHEVPDADVFFNGPSFWVHDSGNKEILRSHVPEAQKRASRWRRGKRLTGTTLLFATSAGAHCYYHWMLEILPKLGMLEREGIPLNSIDHFLVREITAQWQLETLARFGIDRSRIVETANKPDWRCKRLLHIDLNCGINLKMHRFIPQWMKHLYPQETSNQPRIKLYITRPAGVRRGISNEGEFLPLLHKAGFTVMPMEGLSVADQAALLARADVLMSPHGGALTNMVFCRPGIKVVEILSRHVFPYYYGLAANCGHQYHAILENPEKDYSRLTNIRTAQSFADTQHETAGLSFDAPVDAIKAVLELV